MNEETLEKRREYVKRYYYAHKEQQLEKGKKRAKERYASDEEYRKHRSELMKKYYAKNKEKIQAQQKEYREKNIEKIRAFYRERYIKSKMEAINE